MASTRPVAPTARAIGTVHSPRLAPTSTATAPGRRKPRAAGWARGGCSSACRPRASSGRGTLTRSPVRWRTKPPGQSRSSRVSRRFSRHRLTRRAPGGSGSPGGRSFQSALRRAIMARRSPGPLRRCLMSMFDLTGRVAVVTGGNGGIGLGMAKGLAAAGAAVVLAARNKTKAQAALSELRAIGAEAEFTELDVLDERSCREAVQRTANRFGRLDILVNNAGTTVRKQPVLLTAQDWRLV